MAYSLNHTPKSSKISEKTIQASDSNSEMPTKLILSKNDTSFKELIKEFYNKIINTGSFDNLRIHQSNG